MEANLISDFSSLLSAAEGNPLFMVVAMAGLAAAPFLMLSLTSFIKLSIVFSILRNALGAGQVPSGAISTLLSLALTLHIMAPVAEQTLARLSENVPQSEETTGDSEFKAIQTKFLHAASPIESFLRRHSREEERLFFTELTVAREAEAKNQDVAEICADSAPLHDCYLSRESFLTLIPSFVISELRAAFAFGFLIYLPFLVVDLVVANVLMGLGMVMVSPVTISLPFKLLLFVACDGWYLLCRGLILSYGG